VRRPVRSSSRNHWNIAMGRGRGAEGRIPFPHSAAPPPSIAPRSFEGPFRNARVRHVVRHHGFRGGVTFQWRGIGFCIRRRPWGGAWRALHTESRTRTADYGQTLDIWGSGRGVFLRSPACSNHVASPTCIQSLRRKGAGTPQRKDWLSEKLRTRGTERRRAPTERASVADWGVPEPSASLIGP
jgi:hypothetical protein